MEKQELKLIRQPNNYTCIAACAAMVTHTTLEEFIKFAGHDGSDNSPDSPHPDKRRGFGITELAAYLSLHGYHLGCWFDADMERPKDVQAETLSIWSVKSLTLPPPNEHVVVWTGKEILDPNQDEPQKQNKYTVTEWWPIVKWESLAKPLWNTRTAPTAEDGLKLAEAVVQAQKTGLYNWKHILRLAEAALSPKDKEVGS